MLAAQVKPETLGTRRRHAGKTPGHPLEEAAMATSAPVIHSDPEILGGTPVFVGTRVPVESLFDYFEAGETLDHFLAQFPTVTRDQALAALEQARESLVRRARST
jgi:uncharacterized protein (DUF433 family)